MTRVIHATVIAAEPCVRPESLSATYCSVSALSTGNFIISYFQELIETACHGADIILRSKLIIAVQIELDISIIYTRLQH